MEYDSKFTAEGFYRIIICGRGSIETSSEIEFGSGGGADRQGLSPSGNSSKKGFSPSRKVSRFCECTLKGHVLSDPLL